ncbi:Putative RxLR effector [Phytophthora palmivora]|uniref:RxLR effector protein n=1 Tax=Phytophthora palmivora TaxID=4796 RepID=A0A2P4YKS5_9STRA|nr:Putative RxLR effector [Phytophthora palmivora]
MHPSYIFVAYVAVTLLSSCQALPTETITKPNTVVSEASLEALRYLRGVQTDDDEAVDAYKTVGKEDDDDEERGGGWLGKALSRSNSAHITENQGTITRNFLQEGQQAFRNDVIKRLETYEVWKNVKYTRSQAENALRGHGYTKAELKEFLNEFDNFNPETLKWLRENTQ